MEIHRIAFFHNLNKRFEVMKSISGKESFALKKLDKKACEMLAIKTELKAHKAYFDSNLEQICIILYSILFNI